MDIIYVVADAGATKTDWWIFSRKLNSPVFLTTGGINIAVDSDFKIREVLDKFHSYLQDLDLGSKDRSIQFNFFGAGCNALSTKRRLEDFFFSVFEDDNIRIACDSDLRGAALALFGEDSGIACILGTGSASALSIYGKIRDSVPSLGYILGDEGSGTHMGRILLNKYFKRELAFDIEKALRGFADMDLAKVIDNVYREPYPNRFLASFMPFIVENRNSPDISSIIDFSLKLFFEKNVLKYNYSPGDSIGFVGSVGCIFSDRLKALSQLNNLVADRFIDRPIECLGNYFISCITIR